MMRSRATLLLSALLVGLTGIAGAVAAPSAQAASTSVATASERSAAAARITPAMSDALTVRDVAPAGSLLGAGQQRRVSGVPVLDALSVLPTASIARYIDSRKHSVSELLTNPPAAAAVARWWIGLADSARSAVRSSSPELVGNLDGVPVAERDRANRAFLADSIADARRSIDTLGRADRADALKRLHMLCEIQRSLVTTAGEPARSLLSVDTEWPGRAAVVVGDLQAADFVSFMVPGMFFTVDGQMVDWTVISQDLYKEQVDWVHTLGNADATMRGKRVAVVSWIGYQTPGVLDIASLDLAKEGAKYISSAVDGVKATRPGEAPHLTLVSHSYGSTASLIALADGSVTVDSLVVIGSPGSAAQSVDDIRMPASRVFVGEAAWDPVVNCAFFGSDPGASSFGATPMSVAGMKDPITGKSLAPATGHLGYFDAGTEAMRNMALVGLGEGALVSGDRVAPTTNQVALGR